MCGIDEAGRGPCAGPLVVAGVKLTESIKGLNDSKKLSEKRETLFDEIIKKEWIPYSFYSCKRDRWNRFIKSIKKFNRRDYAKYRF